MTIADKAPNTKLNGANSTKYFKAYMRNHLNNEYIVYGIAFEDMGETIESKALHIAKVRGYGKLTLIKFDLYRNGKELDGAEYERFRRFNNQNKGRKDINEISTK